MIIDLILDRKDSRKAGIFNYNPHNFYMEVMEYSEIFNGIGDKITYAMDELEEEDVKKALCDYVGGQNYNPEICDFIKSVEWLKRETPLTDKQKALETLEKVKRIYDEEGGDLLSGGFWAEFMRLCNEQIAEIKNI